MQVIRGKTAALFAAATEVGGVIAGARPEQVAALAAYGDALGVSFQITDDLLDYGGVSARLGKNVGDDFRERKMSLPVIRAVAQADDAERAFWRRVIEKGDQGDGRPGGGDRDHGAARRPREHAGRRARSCRPGARGAGAAARRPAEAQPRRPGGFRGGAAGLSRVVGGQPASLQLSASWPTASATEAKPSAASSASSPARISPASASPP